MIEWSYIPIKFSPMSSSSMHIFSPYKLERERERGRDATKYREAGGVTNNGLIFG
jgi:hypothetical protein